MIENACTKNLDSEHCRLVHDMSVITLQMSCTKCLLNTTYQVLCSTVCLVFSAGGLHTGMKDINPVIQARKSRYPYCMPSHSFNPIINVDGLVGSMAPNISLASNKVLSHRAFRCWNYYFCVQEMAVAPQEQYSEFPNKKCDDIDLLTVAHKIADHCEYIKINEIGRGLGLNESTAQRVAEQHQHSSHGDAIHELLLQWKEKAVTPADEVIMTTDEAITADAEAAATADEAAMADTEATTTAEDTWANLMLLLHSIFNSEPLMKALSDYLRQKVDPNPENGKSCMPFNCIALKLMTIYASIQLGKFPIICAP